MKHFLFILLLNLPFLVFSQFKESFLTENLPESWIGDCNSFVISNQTLFLNGKDETESVSLALPYDLKDGDKEWEFTLNLNLTPSNSNYITIFPVSVSSNSPSGFFFRAGYNTSNRIRFGISPDNIQQTNKYDKFNRTILHIKIHLKENRYWTVYSQNLYEEDSYLQKLGSLDVETDFPKSVFFCIQIRHTKTHKTDFGIKNISYQTRITEEHERPVQPEESDIKLLFIEPLSLYEIKFSFNVPVSKDKAKFYISGEGYQGKCEAHRVVYGNNEQTSIFINFTDPMVLNKDYTFYIEDLYAKSGQSVLNEEIPVHFQVEDDGKEKPEEPGNKPDNPEINYPENSIRINEVMADPKDLTLLPETEYVELYNSLDQEVLLNGVSLEYDNRIQVPLDGITIPPKSFVILYRSGREISSGQSTAYPLDKFPSALANTGKNLKLKDPNGYIINEYTYPEAEAAHSWEYSLKGWHLSSDKRGGTPGEKNSDGVKEEIDKPKEPEKEPDIPVVPEEQTIPSEQLAKAGDIVFNELLPEPFIGGEEYIELYNRSDKTLCIKDLCISTRKTDESLNTHYPLNEYTNLIKPGDYLLLTKSMDKVEAFYTLPTSLNYLECKLPTLSNSGSSIVLYREETEEIIDEVRYSPKWYAPTIKDHKGVALERIDPDKDSQEPSNWTSAATSFNFGTPGDKNSQHLSGRDTETGNEYISDPIYQPSGHYLIPYQLNLAGYSARGWIFDLSGRKAAILADNEQLGTNGSLEWDGLGSNGSSLDSGIYILYIELWHPNGSVIKKKKAFLVH